MDSFFTPVTASLIPAATLILCFLASFSILVLDRPAASSKPAARKSVLSQIGIVIQGLGFAAAGIGVVKATLHVTVPAFLSAALVAGLFAAFIALFRAARAALGANWSLVARMSEDHGLVTSGPFAYIRHPIYTGLLFMLLAMTVGLGTWSHLIVALPLFAIGTAIRVAEEERLLRATFGPAYDAYAARVARFIPGIF